MPSESIFRPGLMKNLQISFPFWVRAILLAGVVCVLAGAGLIGYRYYAQPRTLTIAVGSLDGEAKQVTSLIASHLAATDARIRLKVENEGSVLDAAKASIPARSTSRWCGPTSAICTMPARWRSLRMAW